jgi:predicted acetyltransferase
MVLRLRPFELRDEDVARAADRASLRESQRFLVAYSDDLPWPTYLEVLEAIRRGDNLTGNMVRGDNLAAEVNGELVGRVSLRYELNEFLRSGPGHIGYHVIERHRGKGFATEMLRLSLELTRASGISDALVTCDVDNLASARVIEKCGGIFQDVATSSVDGRPIKRFQFP